MKRTKQRLFLMAGIVLSTVNVSVFAKSTIGGIVFVNTYNTDIDTSQTVDIDDINSIINETNTNRTKLDLANNSRIRIRWDNEDSVGMYVETAIGDSVKLRHAYGKWDINEKHQLLAGRTSTPFAPLNPSVAMLNNSGEGYGSVSPGRRDQIRYTYKFLSRQGALAIALVDPDVKNADADAENTTQWPRLDIGLAYKTFNWRIFPSMFFARQSFDGQDDITTFGYSVGAKTAIGPVTFTGEVGVGENWGNTQMSLGSSFAGKNSHALVDSLTEIGEVVGEDNENTSYWFDVAYRFTVGETKGAAHFIYGSSESELGDTRDLKSTMVGVSVPIDLPWIARGFRIRPEIFRFKDEDKFRADARDETIFGVQLQYTF